jgi:hypothetical protein
MDTTREAEPSREHRAGRGLVLSTLEQYMNGGEPGASGGFFSEFVKPVIVIALFEKKSCRAKEEQKDINEIFVNFHFSI